MDTTCVFPEKKKSYFLFWVLHNLEIDPNVGQFILLPTGGERWPVLGRTIYGASWEIAAFYTIPAFHVFCINILHTIFLSS